MDKTLFDKHGPRDFDITTQFINMGRIKDRSCTTCTGTNLNCILKIAIKPENKGFIPVADIGFWSKDTNKYLKIDEKFKQYLSMVNPLDKTIYILPKETLIAEKQRLYTTLDDPSLYRDKDKIRQQLISLGERVALSSDQEKIISATKKQPGGKKSRRRTSSQKKHKKTRRKKS